MGSRTSMTFIKKKLEISIPLDDPNTERNKSFMTPDYHDDDTPLLENSAIKEELAEMDQLTESSEETEFERVVEDNSSIGKTSDGTHLIRRNSVEMSEHTNIQRVEASESDFSQIRRVDDDKSHFEEDPYAPSKSPTFNTNDIPKELRKHNKDSIPVSSSNQKAKPVSEFKGMTASASVQHL